MLGNYFKKARAYFSAFTTERFLVLTLSLFVLFWFSNSIPLITEQLLRFIPVQYVLKFRILHPLTSGIGPGKRWFIEQMCLYCLGLNIIVLWLSYERSKKFIYKAAVLTLFLPIYWTGVLEFKTNMLETQFNELVVANYPSLNFEKIFTKEMIHLDKMNSFDDFYDFSKEVYLRNKSLMESRWKIDDEDELKSIFYMNLVSRLWGYGNIKRPDLMGCVLNNEKHGKIDPSQATIKTYLGSEIGCCSDYAKILKFLLDKEGLLNRYVEVRGHIFNEVFYGGKWHSMDANINVVYNDSWINITFRPPGQSFQISLFPHHNLQYEDNKDYRDSVGRFRYKMIISAVKRNLLPIYRKVTL